MAVVISSEESAHFAPGLRRSLSQPKFPSKQTGFRQSSSTSRISDAYHQSQFQQHSPVRVFSGSPDLSAPSSPRQEPVSDDLDATAFLKPAPRSTLRLPGGLDRPGYGSSPSSVDDAVDLDTGIECTHYDGVSYFHPPQDLALAASHHDSASSNGDHTLSSGPSRTNSSDFDPFDHVAEDDTAVRIQPSRHVDYLSHNWREEDIWESWKYIVSRRGDYSNSARLENASWRTWMKSKNKLKTVSPETLNWLKDCDVTWLYGPLQTGHDTIVPTANAPADSVGLTKSSSFLASKKPILKKRSMSEIMLQRSLSASSLVKQAAAAVQAQQKDRGVRRVPRPRLERAATDYVTFPMSSRRHSPGLSSVLGSASSSGIISPSSERKHIHFNEQVEQCIVVEAKEEDEDGDMAPSSYMDDSDSDDGAIMMKRTTLKRRLPPRRRPSVIHPNESKTIAMLPSTTLKTHDDEDALPEGSAMKHSYGSPVLSPSSSQETLRPSKPSGNMFFGADDDDDESEGDQNTNTANDHSGGGGDDDGDDSDDEGFGLSMGGGKGRHGGLSTSASTSRLSSARIDLSFPTSSGGGEHSGSTSTSTSTGGGGGGLKRTTSINSISGGLGGMRRTASGMLMPYDEGGSSRLLSSSSFQRRH